MIYKLSKEGERNFAIRFSEFEGFRYYFIYERKSGMGMG